MNKIFYRSCRVVEFQIYLNVNLKKNHFPQARKTDKVAEYILSSPTETDINFSQTDHLVRLLS